MMKDLQVLEPFFVAGCSLTLLQLNLCNIVLLILHISIACMDNACVILQYPSPNTDTIRHLFVTIHHSDAGVTEKVKEEATYIVFGLLYECEGMTTYAWVHTAMKKEYGRFTCMSMYAFFFCIQKLMSYFNSLLGRS